MEGTNDNRLKYVHKRGENLFEIQIPNGKKSDGTRDRITRTYHGDEEGAIAFKDSLLQDLEKKKKESPAVSNSGYTLIEGSIMYLEDRNYQKRHGTTVKGYKRMLNNYILPEFGKKKIRNIVEDDIDGLYNKMRTMINKRTGEPLTETTIKHVHNLLNGIFNYFIHRKWLLYNPVAHIDNKPKFSCKERDYYDESQIKYALNCLNNLPKHKNGVSDSLILSQNIRFKAAITILFNTGLRKEELFGLKWKDIKYSEKKFEIRRAVVSLEEEYCNPEDVIEFITDKIVCKPPKNESSRRNVAVPACCLDVLTDYRKDQIKNGYKAGEDDYIFQQVRKHGFWNPSYLTKEWAEFIKYFNLKKITVHDIRHSHATDLLNSGVYIQIVSKRLGHSDVATTLKIYSHCCLGEDRMATENLEKRYNNYYVSNVLNFKTIISIITGIELATEKEITFAISYVFGEKAIFENRFSMIQKCKEYLLKQCEYLRYVSNFIKSENDIETNEAFVKLLSSASYDVSQIRPMYGTI